MTRHVQGFIPHVHWRQLPIIIFLMNKPTRITPKMVTLIEHEYITGTLTTDMPEQYSIFRKSLDQIKPQDIGYHLNIPN